jgi:hypothetical protein
MNIEEPSVISIRVSNFQERIIDFINISFWIQRLDQFKIKFSEAKDWRVSVVLSAESLIVPPSCELTEPDTWSSSIEYVMP